MLSALHRKLVHPLLKKWALKDPEYSLLTVVKDRWWLPRWVHHFGVKALLQGVWPVPAFLVLAFPLWLGVALSLYAMWSFKNWKKHPRNVLDILCDTLLQVLIPVIFVNPWLICVICPIYWALYPYATP